MHRRLADVLDGDWDVVVPDQHLHVCKDCNTAMLAFSQYMVELANKK